MGGLHGGFGVVDGEDRRGLIREPSGMIGA
jgi:hypothetical protein